jgi:hypothetical protein
MARTKSATKKRRQTGGKTVQGKKRRKNRAVGVSDNVKPTIVQTAPKRNRRVGFKNNTKNSASRIWNKATRGKRRHPDGSAKSGSPTGTIGFFRNVYIQALMQQAGIALTDQGYTNVPCRAQHHAIVPYAQHALLQLISPIASDAIRRAFSVGTKTVTDRYMFDSYRAFLSHRPDLKTNSIDERDFNVYLEKMHRARELKELGMSPDGPVASSAMRHKESNGKSMLKIRYGVLPISDARIRAIGYSLVGQEVGTVTDDRGYTFVKTRTLHKNPLRFSASGKDAFSYILHHLGLQLFKYAFTIPSSRLTWKTLTFDDVRRTHEDHFRMSVHGFQIPPRPGKKKHKQQQPPSDVVEEEEEEQPPSDVVEEEEEEQPIEEESAEEEDDDDSPI